MQTLSSGPAIAYQLSYPSVGSSLKAHIQISLSLLENLHHLLSWPLSSTWLGEILFKERLKGETQLGSNSRGKVLEILMDHSLKSELTRFSY